MGDVQLAIDAIRGKQDTLSKALDYYLGDQEEVFGSAKLKKALSRYGKSFQVNVSQKVVDSVLDRLDIASIATGNGVADAMLEAVWNSNDLDLEEKEFHRWSLVFGEAYAMVWPTEDEPQIMYISPQTCHLFYDETGRNKVFAARMWSEDGGKTTRINLYYSDRMERYISIKKNPKTEGEFVPYGDDWLIPYEFGEVPIFHFRTRRPHGTPEHEVGYNIQDIINKLVVTQMATTDYHGAPQRYALAHPDNAGGSSDMSDFAEEDGEYEESTLRSGPGELWYLNGVDKVGQFDPADPGVFLTPYQQYVRTLSALTSTPIHHFEGMDGAPSGEALRAAEAPLVRKVSSRQANFEATWQEIFIFALSLEGIPVEAVEIEWEPATIVSDNESWNAAVLKINAGLPLEQVLVEQGYSALEIERVLNSPVYNMNQKLKALDTIGTTIQRLGAAQAIGAVDAEAAAVVSALIKGVVADLDVMG